MKRIQPFLVLGIIVILMSPIFGNCNAANISLHTDKVLTLDQAATGSAALYASKAALPYSATPPPAKPFRERTYAAIEPVKVFDKMWWVGTSSVGSLVIDTGDGLVMIDDGNEEKDCKMMVSDMKKVGLDPSKVKLILISHEHFDHYGGTQYLKNNVCPDAKVALSLIGWNMLQTVPGEWAYREPRPQHIDIFLIDGMKLKLGDTTFQCIFTPGHSPGCMSFIFNVKDNGVKHMFGVMGGSAVWPTQIETRLYQCSIEYFKAFTTAAGVDCGLGVHQRDTNFTAIRARKTGEPNPFIFGADKYDSAYLQGFRNSVKRMLDSGDMIPYFIPKKRSAPNTATN